MEQQRDLLKQTPWRALIILDACRADTFAECLPRAAELCGAAVDGGSAARTVESMSFCTYRWAPKLAGLIDGEEVTCITANPVVNRELAWKRQLGNWHFIDVWRDGWGRYGPHQLPTVHPRSVNEATGTLLANGDTARAPRLIVWYIQPHMPYIGENSIPYGDWGNVKRSNLAREANKLMHPVKAVQKGLIDAGTVRRAYEGNVDLVLPCALDLAEDLVGWLGGSVVITADHGELLGEGGRFGHMAGPKPELMHVPWLEINPPQASRGAAERQRKAEGQ